MIENEQVVQTTKNWIETFVLGLNLCPFARHSYKNDKIRYIVFEGDSLEELGLLMVKELDLLNETSASVLETTIVIVKDAFEEFELYLEIYYALEDLVTQMDYDGVFQLASFHPNYLFDETSETDVENYTNRSPYPLFHILREDSVTRSVEAFPEVGDIVERNQETMNQLGLLTVKKMFDEL
jgi:uncharacterized protein